MCLAMAFFIISDMFSKLASEAMPVSQVLTMRGFYAALMFAVPVIASGSLALLPKLFSRLWALRIVGEIGAAMTFLAALAHMPIANVTTIIQTARHWRPRPPPPSSTRRTCHRRQVGRDGRRISRCAADRPTRHHRVLLVVDRRTRVGRLRRLPRSSPRRMDRAIPGSLINVYDIGRRRWPVSVLDLAAGRTGSGPTRAPRLPRWLRRRASRSPTIS